MPTAFTDRMQLAELHGVGFGTPTFVANSPEVYEFIGNLSKRMFYSSGRKLYRSYRWLRWDDSRSHFPAFDRKISALDKFEEPDRSIDEALPATEDDILDELADNSLFELLEADTQQQVVSTRLARKNRVKRHKNAPLHVTTQGSKYINDVVYRVKLKFDVPKMNSVNRKAVREYAVRLMTMDNHRPAHQVRDLAQIIPLVFTPTANEMLESKLLNAPTAVNRRERKAAWDARADSEARWFRRFVKWNPISNFADWATGARSEC